MFTICYLFFAILTLSEVVNGNNAKLQFSSEGTLFYYCQNNKIIHEMTDKTILFSLR